MTRATDTSSGGEISEDEILSELRAEIRASKSAYSWAKSNGLHENDVYCVLKRRGKMSPKVAEALGYTPVRKWVKV